MLRKVSLLTMISTLLLFSFAFAGDKYTLDLSHSSAGFAVQHLVISKTKGHFNKFSGKFEVDENDLTNSKIDVSIQVASIDTDDEKRDTHLRGADFFNAEEFPTIRFKSTSFEEKDDEYFVTGNLTIKDVTKEITFPFTFNGLITDPWGNKRFGAEASLEIDRQDFDVKWNKTLDNGGLLVGNEVKIELDVEGIMAREGTN